MLVLSLSTFLVTIINIGILFFVLRAILFKPVTKFMESRTMGIQNTLDQAEKDRSDAKLLLKQYEEQLQDVHKEAQAVLNAAREAAQRESDRMLAEGKAGAEQLLANGRKQLEAERQAAMALFKAEAAVLVISASSRLLQRDLNQEDSRRQAALLIQEIGK
jgi:F-type H+-transporting ATPase subunit b